MTSQKENASGVALGYHEVLGEHIWTQPSYKVSVYIFTALGVYIWSQPSCSTANLHQLRPQFSSRGS